MLDPRRLRLLVLLDGLGTVRGVGQRASLSPSAVSQQLAVLEREAQTALFERHGRTIALTDAGSALVVHARAILSRIEAAEEDLTALRSAPTGTVTVAGFTSALRAFVIDAAAAVRAAHPGIAVRLEEVAPEACVGALERGDADLAIVGDFGAGDLAPAPQLHAVALVQDELFALLPPGHPAASGPVALTALRDDPWVVDGTELERHVVRACRQAGFEPRVAARLFAHESIVHAVRAGLGVTVLPGFALALAEGVEIRPLTPAAGRSMAVLHRPDALERRAVVLTLETLVATARAARASQRPRADRP